MPTPRLFVFGLGYSALALARVLMAEGWRVAGTTRSPERKAELDRTGIETFLFDRERPLDAAAAALAGATHLLLGVPPDDRGDPALALHGAEIAALTGLEWAGYLSTTGVYGDTGGEWVSEASWLKPTGERQRRRVAAERGWLDLHRRHGVPMHVFRLAGIYGPGRSAVDSLRAGTAKRIDKPGHVFCRIHVDDVAGVLRASMERPNLGGIYNVADDLPAPQHEVVEHAARLLGVEPPPLIPFADADLSPMAASFYADCRRVRNDRIRKRLGAELRYPDYRAGLAGVLAADGG